MSIFIESIPFPIILFCAITMVKYVNSHTGLDVKMKKLFRQLTKTLIILVCFKLILVRDVHHDALVWFLADIFSQNPTNHLSARQNGRNLQRQNFYFFSTGHCSGSQLRSALRFWKSQSWTEEPKPVSPDLFHRGSKLLHKTQNPFIFSISSNNPLNSGVIYQGL